MAELEAFRSLILVLASSGPDALPRRKRSDLAWQAKEQLTSNEDCRQLLSVWKDLKCTSPHAFRRILPLYMVSLEFYLRRSEGGDKDALEGLVDNLCRLLRASKQVKLVQECRLSLVRLCCNDSKPKKKRKKNSGEDDTGFPPLNIKCRNVLVQRLFHIAKNDRTVFCTAVALGFDNLGAAADETANNDDWWTLFIAHAFGGPTLPSLTEIQLMEPFLSSSFAKQHDGAWPTDLLESALLKVKANPEGGLETLRGIMLVITPQTQVPWQIQPEYMTVLATKHLVAAKDTVRECARKIIRCATRDPTSLVSLVLPALHTQLPKNTTAPQRETLYRLWIDLSLNLLVRGDSPILPVKELEPELPKVFDALINLVSKEGAGVTSTAGNRDLGLSALWQWLVVAKRNNPQNSSASSEAALELLRKPIIAKNGAETVAMVGHFVHCIVDPDLLESMVMDLFATTNKGLDIGLDALVTNAITAASGKKQTVCVEGLLALYLGLVYALAVGGNTKAFVFKAFKSTPCFVWAAPVTEAVVNPSSTNHALASLVLPRVLALAAKLSSTTSDPSMLKINPFARALACCITHPNTSTISDTTTSNKPDTAVLVLPKKKRRKGNAGSSSVGASPASAIAALTHSILSCQPKVTHILIEALLIQVNSRARHAVDSKQSQNATRQAREEETATTYGLKGSCSANDSHWGMDTNAVRRVASQYLPSGSTTAAKDFVQVLLLMHIETSLRTEGHQRRTLRRNTMEILKMIPQKEDAAFKSSVAKNIAHFAAKHGIDLMDEQDGSTKDSLKDPTSMVISDSVHRAALSAISSLGGIAENFLQAEDPEADGEAAPRDENESKACEYAGRLCTVEIPGCFAECLTFARDQCQSLSQEEINLFLSPPGVPFSKSAGNDGDGEAGTVGTAGGGAKVKRGKGGGFNAKEDEEWEQQLRQELEKKKQQQSKDPGVKKLLTAEEQKLVEKQAEARKRISSIVHGDFTRSLAAIRSLCLSDIEVGNACLPVLSEPVVSAAVSNCPAMQVPGLMGKTYQTLVTMASSVFEIHEDYAPMLATALTVSCKGTKPCKAAEGAAKKAVLERKDSQKDDDGILVISALPANCPSAACAIGEMNQFHGPLSGNSFVFLFPIVRAALMGPRTAHGCEAALRVLAWHTPLLAGDEVDAVVAPLRKNMVISVLELLKHDRAQTFSDPNPTEALVSCYRMEDDGTLSNAELAPLLDDRGALGSKSCRAAAMIALAHIASEHRGLITKKNPLIENRIWLNCFDKNDSVRIEARTAWRVINGGCLDERDDDELANEPGLMYAAPLLPLLSNPDRCIASAAADAYAKGMAMHPKSVNKNIQKLCNSYVEAFPSSVDDGAKKTGSLPAVLPMKATVAPPNKPAASMALPKKKTVVKSNPLSVAGIGKPKTTKKKSSAVTAALLKPKQERTLDQNTLVSQFQTGVVGPAKEESKDSPDKIETRLGILQAVTSLTKTQGVEMDVATLKMLTSFLMAYGIAEIDEIVKGVARDSLRDTVATFGGTDEAIGFLLPHLEDILKTGKITDETAFGSLSTAKVPRDVAASDRRKEGAVVALGSVALHLNGPENESKIDSTIDMLLHALATPSEDVQASIAECLTKLMKKGNTQDRLESILTNLLQECLHGETLASRRGAAYGISAVVKGSGIATLKKYDIVKKLEEACASAGSSSKEGSLFAIELLSERLGLLFEPYVIVLLPSLLKSFSDSSDHVRKAASDTCSLIMSKLSAHGVKLVMPAVLTAFNDPAWRTKQASIRMLGAMSHLAPKQLASALPKVVPKLTEAFADTHPKVKATAEEALDEISTVVRNPEISSISSILLKALTDPANHTTKALEGLIETEFLHAIDAPSLALIVPILHRGLRDRGATTKRYGALIAGNICTMINDSRDFVPYLPILLPDLKASLLDPIPDVRSTSARALGSLTRGLGDSILLDLRPWLIKTLGDEKCSSAERSGAAQGLTEVLVAAGTSVVEDAMRNEILPLRNHPLASTREGVLWMLTFLPSTMGQGFTPLMDSSLPALIGGLSDDSEPVREVAMRAGRVLIRSHGKVHVDKILPSLEIGLNDEDYRIRLASLTLLGDLLSTIGGTTLMTGDGDTREDIRRAEKAQAQIALTLGSDKRKRVLSSLYLARSDGTSVVRHHAVQVWKTVVSVTGRTLKDILPVLVGQILEGLASGDPERTLVAGRCLGEIVTKLGESVFPEIIPVLRNALYEGDEPTKRGVCVGLSEVIKSSTKDQIVRYIDIIVKLVQDALCDEDEEVRLMAASSFQSLYLVVGSRAMDEVVPSLMVALELGKDEASRKRALNGLTAVIADRRTSRDLLPYVVPRLLSKPVTKSHAEALSSVGKVTGGTIYLHFHSIIPCLLGQLAELRTELDKDREEAIRDCVMSLFSNVEAEGVSSLVSEIASKCSNDKADMRTECCWMFEVVFTERSDAKDVYEFVPTIVRELLYRLNDENADVLKACHKALTALSDHVPAEESVKHIEFMRNLINSMVSESRRRKGGVGDGEFLLPGFNIPNGLEPLLPIYQRGILYGTATIREVSATGLGEVIALTSTKYLAGPVIIKMTGPLLRVVGDRNPSNVKIAILRTLGLILVKGGPALRAFVPQFQTTFVKALADPSRQVRVEATKALSLLMPLSTRVDPLIKELVGGAQGKTPVAGETGGAISAVQTATLEALAAVLKDGGKKAKLPDTIRSAFDAAKELLEHEDETVREGAAKVMGASVELQDPSVAEEVLREYLLVEGVDSGDIRHGKACAIRQVFASPIARSLDQSLQSKALKTVLSYMNDDKGTVKEAGCVAFGSVIGSSNSASSDFKKVEPVLLEIMGNSRAPIEIHRAVAAGLCLLLQLLDVEQSHVEFMGKALLKACLQLAMSGAQRVQFAYNDVLWLALNVANGQDGLDHYAGMAEFENVKAMKSLHSKVLTRIKEITLLNDY